MAGRLEGWLALVFVVTLSCEASGQEAVSSRPTFAVHVEAGMELPLVGDGATSISASGGLKASGELSLGGGVPAFAALEAAYALGTVNLAGTLVHTVAAGPGIGIAVPLGSRFTLRGYASAGYYLTMVMDEGQVRAGGNPYAEGLLGLHLLLGPGADLGLSVGYRQLFGLYGGLTATLGTSFYLGGTTARAAQIQGAAGAGAQRLGPVKPPAGKGIKVASIDVDSIFPVLRNYYDDHAIGAMKLVSLEASPITGISAKLRITGYMDSAKELAVPSEIAPGAAVTIDLYALLSRTVMEISESEKAPLSVTLSYTVGSQQYEDEVTRTVTIFGRNNMTWDDTRKAAAFVTRNDPTVQAIVTCLSAATVGQQCDAIGRRLLTAIAVHDVTLLAGLQYKVDPSSSYATLSGHASQVDTLNFPVQTLAGLGGDCDDLSILYATLMEAMGVPAAFITAPGHIYIALDLGTPPADLGQMYSTTGDFFARDGHLWVPIEVTERGRGFADAWRTGAQEWRADEGGPAFGIYPLADALALYNPVSADQGAAALSVPSPAAVAAAVKQDIAVLRTRELTPLLAQLATLDPKGTNASVQNKAAVLSARYGDLDRAEALLAPFTRTTATAYVPALMNLGALKMLRGRYEEALALFTAASARLPDNAAALAGLAQASYELGRLDAAKAAYARVKALSPALAAKLSYIDQETKEGSTRASNAADRVVAIWSE